MFSLILRCLEQQFCTPKDTDLVANLLCSLSRLDRFSIVHMFMDSNDKKGNVKITEEIALHAYHLGEVRDTFWRYRTVNLPYRQLEINFRNLFYSPREYIAFSGKGEFIQSLAIATNLHHLKRQHHRTHRYANLAFF